MNNVPNMNNQGVPSPQQNSMGQDAYNMSELNDVVRFRTAFPEIYYKCMPFIMMASDQMDSVEMPSQEMIEEMTDNIYEDIIRMYPEMDEYFKNAEKEEEAVPAQRFITSDWDRGRGWDRDWYRRRFRRRGLPKDVIQILLLNELFRRRRRY